MSDDLRRGIEQLPARERAVLLLRLNERATYREIAATFGVSEKTVAVHAARGRRRLHQLRMAESTD